MLYKIDLEEKRIKLGETASQLDDLNLYFSNINHEQQSTDKKNAPQLGEALNVFTTE